MRMTPEERADILAALAWQVELGADEAIAEEAQDRLAESAPRAMPAGPVRAGRAPAAPAPPGRTAPAEAPAAAHLAAAADSLEALAGAMRGWEGSELRHGARNFVFADGVPGARVMIVGEAPGGEEDRQGRPFVGRAGRLLDRMLAAIGLARDAADPARAAYIANILPWRPPGNRTPSEAEVTAFLPFVERHIELARPEVVLALGGTSAKALMDTTTGIRRLRGRWRRHHASGLPLLPSFHPAYLLRQPAEKRHAWRDLQALRAVLDGARPEIEE